MRTMAQALAQAGVSTDTAEKAPISDKNFQAPTRIDDEQRVCIADTPAGMMRDACAPNPRPSKKRDKMRWPERTRVPGTRKTLQVYDEGASVQAARLQAIADKYK